jgi:hypothetical protein
MFDRFLRYLASAITFNSVSQGLHTCLGTIAVLLPTLKDFPPWIGAVAILSYAAVKEFWFDVYYETPEQSGGRLGDVEDFSFYAIGVAAAYAILWV